MAERISSEKPPMERPFYIGGAEVQVHLRNIPGITDIDRRRIKAEVISLDAALSNAGFNDGDIDTVLEARLNPTNAGVPVRNVVGFIQPTLVPGTPEADEFWSDFQNIYAAVSRGRHIPIEEPTFWGSKEFFDERIKEVLDQHLQGREMERAAYEETAEKIWARRRWMKGTAFWPFTDHKYRVEDIFIWLEGKNTPAERRESAVAYKRGRISRRQSAREAEGALRTERAQYRAAARRRLNELRGGGQEPAEGESGASETTPRRRAPEPRSSPEVDANAPLSEQEKEEIERLLRDLKNGNN